MNTHLGDANDLAISTPTGMLEKLGDLRALARPRLPYNDGNGTGPDEVQESLSVFGNRQESGWFVESRDKGGTKVKVCHDEQPEIPGDLGSLWLLRNLVITVTLSEMECLLQARTCGLRVAKRLRYCIV